MPAPQNYKNHTRYNKAFHFVMMPLLLLNFIFSFVLFFHHHHHHPHHPYIAAWWIVMSFVLILMAGNARTSALKVQDRVIRLEERMRLASLLPAAEHTIIASLTTGQLIALRFASDDELPALAHRALAENLSRKQIKQAIVAWRPDHHRV
jgi:predicted ABC-type exoprotein transport system permease subunit